MVHKWWWHPHYERWQRMVKDWAGRRYVFDKDWNLIWWEGEYGHSKTPRLDNS